MDNKIKTFFTKTFFTQMVLAVVAGLEKPFLTPVAQSLSFTRASKATDFNFVKHQWRGHAKKLIVVELRYVSASTKNPRKCSD